MKSNKQNKKKKSFRNIQALNYASWMQFNSFELSAV